MPKWPMSAYSASAPVTTSTMDPSRRNVLPGSLATSRTAWTGFTASSTEGSCSTERAPSTPSTVNHRIITGPNTLPMWPVPKRCTAKMKTRTTVVSGAIQLSRAGLWTDRPSIADSTEIEGVITPSPSSSALPKIAIIPKNARRRSDRRARPRGSSDSSENRPPSPRLVARMMKTWYLSTTISSSAQNTMLSTPITNGRSAEPCLMTVSWRAYSGLVPMSPKTTPTAPIASASVPAWWVPPDREVPAPSDGSAASAGGAGGTNGAGEPWASGARGACFGGWSDTVARPAGRDGSSYRGSVSGNQRGGGAAVTSSAVVVRARAPVSGSVASTSTE